MGEESAFYEGSGNIFADIGLPDPGYKPHAPQTIKSWLTNEMYIGWWQPDEDKPDIIIDHHDAILDYALFAEGYTRLTGFTLFLTIGTIEITTRENMAHDTNVCQHKKHKKEYLIT